MILEKSNIRWYDGLPPGEVVREHRSHHLRADYLISRTLITSSTGADVEGEPDNYGNWVCNSFHHVFGSTISFVRLLDLDGVVYVANGYSFWQPLHETKWAKNSRFYPVGQDGLPLLFETL